MEIDSITPATTMDRSCSASASDSDTSGGGDDGEPHPAGHEKKGEPAKPGVVCLKNLLLKAPPEYLTLSLTPSSAHAAAKYRRLNRPEEVSLAYVNAPRDYLSLSVTPSDKPKRRRRRRDVSGGGGSAVADPSSSSVASSGGEEGALVVVEAVLPPPVQTSDKCVPPKKRNLADAGVDQETAGSARTAPAGSSPCLALAIVNSNDGVSRSSSPPGAGGETLSPATMASHPIDVVPLQAVYVHGGVSRPIRLGSSAGEITTNETADGKQSKSSGVM